MSVLTSAALVSVAQCGPMMGLPEARGPFLSVLWHWHCTQVDAKKYFVL